MEEDYVIVGSNHGLFIHDPNTTSCLDKDAIYKTTECYISFVALWASIVVGTTGLLTNSQVLLNYGWLNQLSTSADKYFFFIGLMDTIGCISVIVTYVSFYTNLETTACYAYFFMAPLMTKASFYLFAFIAYARYYQVCIYGVYNHIFLELKKAQVVFLCLILVIAAQTVFSCYLGCKQYDYQYKIFFVYEIAVSDNEGQLFIPLFILSDGIHFVLLFLATIVIYYLYRQMHKEDLLFRIKTDKDDKEERINTKVLRWSALISLPVFWTKELVFLFAYYGTNTSGKHYLGLDVNILLNLVADAFNIIVFVINPILFYKLNGYFRLKINNYWDSKFEPFKKLCHCCCCSDKNVIKIDLKDFE